ncbi:MAG: hypothetical protein ACFFAE_07630 [Candidatus Hodarchaeota archaeon]
MKKSLEPIQNYADNIKNLNIDIQEIQIDEEELKSMTKGDKFLENILSYPKKFEGFKEIKISVELGDASTYTKIYPWELGMGPSLEEELKGALNRFLYSLSNILLRKIEHLSY